VQVKREFMTTTVPYQERKACFRVDNEQQEANQGPEFTRALKKPTVQMLAIKIERICAGGQA
jgi:hypothetical protein